MKNGMKLAGTATISLILVSCGTTTSITKLGDQTFAAKPEDCKIEVLSNPPKRAHVEVALVSASSGATTFEGKDLDSMLPSMKNRACEVGADALIIRQVSKGNSFVGTPGNATAAAIRYSKAK